MLASFLIQTLNGLASASLLFLVALGLTLIFGVTRIVNFAHGSLYMLGAYVAATLFAQARRRRARLLGRRAAGGAGGRSARRADRGRRSSGASTPRRSCCS